MTIFEVCVIARSALGGTLHDSYYVPAETRRDAIDRAYAQHRTAMYLKFGSIDGSYKIMYCTET